ncbi:MAG: PorT family protein [Bacteroidales bacterium]|nr:PorT family protein [Bacteroidales bacterium]
MKTKLILITLLLFVIQAPIFAQDAPTDKMNHPPKPKKQEFKTFRIGVFGETAISWMKPKMDLNHKVQYEADGSRLVAGWGLLFDVNFTENYTLSTGFRLGGTGGKLTYLDSLGTTAAKLHRKYELRYVDVPIELKLKTNQIGYFTYFFQIGLRPGMRLAAYVDDKFDYSNKDDNYSEFDNKKESAFFQLGFNVGLGAEYQISKSFSAFVGLNYRDGLIDVLSGTNAFDPTLNENAFINQVALTAGFLF